MNINKQPGLPSQEDAEKLKEDVRQALTLEQMETALYWAVKRDEWSPTQYGPGRVEYRTQKKDWDNLKKFPDLAAFPTEEADLLASGVPAEEIQRASGLYQKAYEKLAEIRAQVGALKKANPRAFDIALRLRVGTNSNNWKDGNFMTPWDQLPATAYQEALADIQGHEKKSAERSEYWDIERKVIEVKDGMRAKALLDSQTEKAKKAGLASAEELWEDNLKVAREFKNRVGDEQFSRFAGELNSHLPEGLV